MPTDGKTKFLYNVGLDVAPEREALFNEVYDQDHIPALLEVPGVVAVRRYRRRPAKVSMAGVVQEFDYEAEPAYSALYEIEGPEVIASAAWSAAVEKGRWAPEIRPFTRNRRLTLHELISDRRK